MKRLLRSAAALMAVLALSTCTSTRLQAPGSVSAERLMDHIKTLSSDEFEGRQPGTQGELKTVAYLTAQFQAMGLEPGNPDARYVQDVPLVGIQATSVLALTVAGRDLPLQPGTDYVATTTRFKPQVSINNSPLVFVGYGVQAPEYRWDDYKGLNAHGKTLVMLINDPPVADPAHPERLDEHRFKGAAMTYYGRWTYKYEIGSKLGADAVLIVHETVPAAYGWNVVQHSWSGEAFHLEEPNGNADHVAVQGWITLETARALFARAGKDFDALKAAAARADFRPVPLNARLSATVNCTLRKVQSQNVVARLPGSDPKLEPELVIYSAHWDHFGRDVGPEGERIFHGAADNGSGVAGLLEIARRFAATRPRPPRSLLFLAPTAEEQGLLGSQYYAEHPLYPLNRTLADINMDIVNLWGRTRDVQVVGYGESTLEDRLAQVARSQQRALVPDTQPEKGRYYRSDQFSFAKVGVPGLNVVAGTEVLGKPAGFGLAKQNDYVAHDYHSPTDVIKPDWNLSGTVEDMNLLYELGREVASDPTWPQWREDSEFKAIRAASMTAP
jgi:Zn-dependent M28 family amino/carboxypeptidase